MSDPHTIDEDMLAADRAWSHVDARADLITKLLLDAGVPLDEVTAAALVQILGGFFVSELCEQATDVDETDTPPGGPH